MAFIAILLSLSLERYFDWSHLRRWQWFEWYRQMLSSTLDRFNPALRLACWLIPPFIVVRIVEYSLADWFFGLPKLIFDFFILLYCFGPANFWAQLYDCIQAMRQGDAPQLALKLKTAFPELSASSAQTLHQALVRAIFIEGEKRVFGVLFWFALLGPAGAMFYRLVALVGNKAASNLAPLNTKALEALDWLPARLLGFLFALGGHFVKVLQVWQKYAFEGLSSSEVIIAETGWAALDLPSNKALAEQGELENQALQLFDRALIIMLILLAFWVLVLA